MIITNILQRIFHLPSRRERERDGRTWQDRMLNRRPKEESKDPIRCNSVEQRSTNWRILLDGKDRERRSTKPREWQSLEPPQRLVERTKDIQSKKRDLRERVHWPSRRLDELRRCLHDRYLQKRRSPSESLQREKVEKRRERCSFTDQLNVRRKLWEWESKRRGMSKWDYLWRIEWIDEDDHSNEHRRRRWRWGDEGPSSTQLEEEDQPLLRSDSKNRNQFDNLHSTFKSKNTTLLLLFSSLLFVSLFVWKESF